MQTYQDEKQNFLYKIALRIAAPLDDMQIAAQYISYSSSFSSMSKIVDSVIDDIRKNHPDGLQPLNLLRDISWPSWFDENIHNQIIARYATMALYDQIPLPEIIPVSATA